MLVLFCLFLRYPNTQVSWATLCGCFTVICTLYLGVVCHSRYRPIYSFLLHSSLPHFPLSLWDTSSPITYIAPVRCDLNFPPTKGLSEFLPTTTDSIRTYHLRVYITLRLSAGTNYTTGVSVVCLSRFRLFAPSQYRLIYSFLSPISFPFSHLPSFLFPFYVLLWLHTFEYNAISLRTNRITPRLTGTRQKWHPILSSSSLHLTWRLPTCRILARPTRQPSRPLQQVTCCCQRHSEYSHER